MESLKEKAARGLLWGGLMNGAQQLVGLAFGIFLARLLTDEDYGMVGMLTIFSAIAGALQEGGFIAALNKRREVTREDYNSVFWFNVLVSLSCYAVLFVCAPLIARFYGEPELVPLARFIFVGFVISSLNVVPRAYMFRELQVKQSMGIGLTAQVVSGVVGALLAWYKFAYWGIATQTVVYVSCITLFCYIQTRWRPSLHFSWRPVREMLGFSSKLIVTSLCNVLNNNFFNVVLGYFYTRADVGNFTQANKWNTMGHTTITQMLYGVAQPVFTKVEDDPARQLSVFRKMLRFSAFFAFPAMLGLSLVSREFIFITITEKWARAVPVLQLLCVWGAFAPVESLFSNLIISRGRSGTYMWCTIALVVTELSVVCLARPLGMDWMLRLFVGVNVGWLFVWHYFVRQLLGLRLRDMLRDILPYLLLSVALCAAAAYACAGISHLWLSLAAKVALVVVGYSLVLWMAGSVIFRESMQFLLKRKVSG